MSGYVNSLVSQKIQKDNALQGNVQKQFKWLGLNERMNRINVDVFHKVRRIEVAPTVETAGKRQKDIERAQLFASFFSQELSTANSRDKSLHFDAFYQDVKRYTASLPLILHFKDRIVDLFLKHIQVPDSIAFNTLLSLFPHLARDLRHELFPHFGQILDVLIETVDESKPDKLEATFQCIAYLFKYLIRSLVDRVDDVYLGYFVSLLSHRRAFIRGFAAESFAYVIRRIDPRKIKSTLAHVLSLPTLQTVSKNVLSATKGDDEADDDEDEDAIARIVSDTRARGVEAVVNDARAKKAPVVVRSSHTVESIEWSDEAVDRLVDGLGKTCFHMVKNVDHGFYSAAAKTLRVMFSLLSMRSKLIRSSKFTTSPVSDALLAEHKGNAKLAQQAANAALMSQQLQAQQTFRARIILSLTEHVNDYTNVDKSHEFWNPLAEYTRTVLLRWRKTMGRIQGLAADMSASETEDDSDVAIDEEVHGRRGASSSDSDDSENEDVVDARRRETPVTSGELSQELVYLMGMMQAFITHRKGLRVHNLSDVADLVMDLIDADVLDPSAHTECPLFVMHAIALYTQTWSISSNVVQGKDLRNATATIKDSAVEAERRLAFSLHEMLALHDQPYVMAYLVGALRRFLPINEFQFRVLPKIVTNVTKVLSDTTQSFLTGGARAADQVSAALALLSIVIAPLPSHDMGNNRHVQALSPIATFQEIVTSVQWLTETYCPDHYVQQQFYPMFVKQYSQLRYSEQLSQLVYSRTSSASTSSNDQSSYNYIKTQSLASAAISTLLQQLAQMMLLATSALAAEPNTQSLSHLWAALQALVGLYPDCSRTVSLMFPAKTASTKKSKSKSSSSASAAAEERSVSIYSVLYTTQTILASLFAQRIRSAAASDADVAFMQSLGHVLALIETVTLSVARVNDGAREDDSDAPDQELELLISFTPFASKLPESLTPIASLLLPPSASPSAVTLESWPRLMLVNALSDVSITSLQHSADGKACLPGQSPLAACSNSDIYGLQLVTLKRLAGVFDEITARMDTAEQGLVHRMLDQTRFWDNTQSKLDDEMIDMSNNRDLVRDVDESDDEYEGDDVFFAVRRSKKLWREYQESMEPVNKKSTKDMRDRPKIDKAMFLSEVERLQKERKAKEAAEREEAITKIMVPKGLTNTQRRQLITQTLQQIRSDREKTRKVENAQGDRLEAELRRQYARVISKGPITRGLYHIAEVLFKRSADPSVPSVTHALVTPMLASFLASPVRAIRALAVEALSAFPTLHFLAQPAPRHSDDSDETPSNLTKHQKGECNLLADLYSIANLPVDLHHHKAVLRRLDTIVAHIETRLLPPVYISIIAPFAYSLFTMHMAMYFEPARKVLEALADHYSASAWPWLYSKLLDTVLHSHVVSSVESKSLQLGAFSPPMPSQELIRSQKATTTPVISTYLSSDAQSTQSVALDASPRRQAAALASTLAFQFSMYNYVDFDCGPMLAAQKELFLLLTMDKCERLVNTNANQLIDLFLIFLRSEFTLVWPSLDTPLKEKQLSRFHNTAVLKFNLNGFYPDPIQAAQTYYDSLSAPERESSEGALAKLHTHVAEGSAIDVDISVQNRTLTVSKMQSFLRMFTGMRRVHAMPIAQSILAPLGIRLLNFPDTNIQQQALALLHKLKLDYLTPYMSVLEKLLDEKMYRNALTTLSVSMNRSIDTSRTKNTAEYDQRAEDEANGIYGGAYGDDKASRGRNHEDTESAEDNILVIDPSHRAYLAPILLSVLSQKLYGTGGKRGKNFHSRRAAITSFLSLIPTQELLPFISFFLRPFLMVFLHASGNTQLLDALVSIEQRQFALAEAPLGPYQTLAAGFTVAKPAIVKVSKKGTVSAINTIECYTPVVVQAFADNTVVTTVASSYHLDMERENTLFASITRMVVSDNAPVVQTALTHVNSTMNPVVEQYLDIEPSQPLVAGIPILMDATTPTLQRLFASIKTFSFAHIDPVHAMHINAPHALSAVVPLADQYSGQRYIFPEIQLTKQLSYLQLLLDLTSRLRTASSPFIATFMTTVLHLYHRSSMRIALITHVRQQKHKALKLKSRINPTMLASELDLVRQKKDDEDLDEEEQPAPAPAAEDATESSEVTTDDIDREIEDLLEETDEKAAAIMAKQAEILRDIRKLCSKFFAQTVDLFFPLFGVDVSAAAQTEAQGKKAKKSASKDISVSASTPETWALTNAKTTLPLVCAIDEVADAATAASLYSVKPHMMYNYLHLFLLASHEQIMKLDVDGVNARSGLTETLVVLARHRTLQPILALPHNAHILNHLFSMLSAPNCHAQVASAVMEVMEHLINTRDQLVAEKETAMVERAAAIVKREKREQKLAALKADGMYDSDDDARLMNSDLEDISDSSSSSEDDLDTEDDMSDDDDMVQQRRRDAFKARRSALDRERIEAVVQQEKSIAKNKMLTPVGEDSSKSPALLEILDNLLNKYAPVLLHHLNARLQILSGLYGDEHGELTLQNVRDAKKRLSHARLPKREYALAEKLSVFVNDSDTAQTLLSILYPYLPVGSPNPPYSLKATGSYTHAEERDMEKEEYMRNQAEKLRERLVSIFGIMRTVIPHITDAKFLVTFQNALAAQFLLVFAPDARSELVSVIDSIVETSQTLKQDSTVTAELLSDDALVVLKNLVAVEASKSLTLDADFTRRAAAYSALRAPTQSAFTAALRSADDTTVEEVDLATARALPSMSASAGVDLVDIDAAPVVESRSAGVSAVGVVRHVSAWTDMQALPIVYAALHDLYSNEFAIRENAIMAIIDMINANIGAAPTSPASEPSSIVTIIHNHVTRSLSNPNFHTPRRYFMAIFGALGQRFPSKFPGYAILSNSNPEHDFFTNIMHIQPARRAAALRRVSTAIETMIQEAKAAGHPDVTINHVKDTNTPQYACPYSQSINSLLFPTVLAFIGESSATATKDAMRAAREGRYRKRNMGTGANVAGIDQSVLDESIRACGLYASLMGWRHYQYRLHQLLGFITSRHELERIYLRAACAVVDHFPFNMGADASVLAASATSVADKVQERMLRARDMGGYNKKSKSSLDDIIGLNGNTAQQMIFDQITDTVVGDDEQTMSDDTKKKSKKMAVKDLNMDVIDTLKAQHVAIDSDSVTVTKPICRLIRRHVGSKILPRLFAFSTDVTMEESSTKAIQNDATMSHKSVGAMRVGVVMAGIKLLQKMSVVDFHVHFPRLMRVVCAQLGRQEIEFRVAARKALVQVLTSVGPAFLFYIVSELHQALTSGVQLHVLGNTLHLCIETLVEKLHIAPGNIDYCLPSLLPLLRDDLIGPVSDEKLVEAFRARHPEIKAITAPHSFQLLSRVIKFNPSILGVTAILSTELSIDRDGKAPSLLTTHKIAHCMDNIVHGLRVNPTVKQEELLLYVHTVLRACTGFKETPEEEMNDDDDDSSDSDSDSSSSDDEWYDDKKEDQRKKKRVVYTGKIHRNNNDTSKIIGNTVVGGKISGGGPVGGIRKTAEETFLLHPSLGGTTWRSAVKEDDKKLSFVNIERAQQFDKTLQLAINVSDDTSVSNYNGGSSMLMYGLGLLQNVMDKRQYSNIPSIMDGADAPVKDDVCCDAATLLGMLEPLPQLLNKAVLLLDRGEKRARREIGNACGGVDAGAVKTALNKFKARSAQVIARTLRVHTQLIRIPLSSWSVKENRHINSLTRFVLHTLSHLTVSPKDMSTKTTGGGTIDQQLDRFSREGNIRSTNLLVRTNCFNIICNGLQYNSHFQLTDNQIQLLLPILQLDLNHLNHGTGAFNVLEALFAKQIMLPQMYDMATSCGELLVRSFEPKCRKLAGNIFLQFLLSYPLTPKRQEQHLSFLLNNLSYEHPSGRQGVVHVLQHIVAKFPFAYIEKYAETMFFPIALAVYNDADAVSKQMLCTLLTTLFRRLSGVAAMEMPRQFHREQLKQHGQALLGIRDTLIHSVFLWLSSKQPAQIRMACLIIGVIARAVTVDFAPYCERLVAVLGKILKGSVTLMLQQAQHNAAAIAEAKRSLRGSDVADDDVTEAAEEQQKTGHGLVFFAQEDAEADVRVQKTDVDVMVTDARTKLDREEEEEKDDDLEDDLGEEEEEEEDAEMADEDDAEEDADDGEDKDAEEDHEEDDEEKVVQLPKSAPPADAASAHAPRVKVAEDDLVRETTSGATAPWHLSYTALCCIEKVWAVAPAAMIACIRKAGCWGYIVQLCLHPHTWVRHATARLMHTHFKALDLNSFADDTYRARATVLDDPEVLFDTAKTVALQMNSQFMDDRLSELLVHNLTFLTIAMYAMRQHAFFVEYNTRVAAILAKVTEEKKQDQSMVVAANVERELTSGFLHAGMHWVIANVSYLARQSHSIPIRTAVYRFYNEIVTMLPGEHLHSFLVAMLNPLYRTIATPVRVAKIYRVMGGDQNFMQKQHDQCKQLATGVCESLKRKCSEVFLKAYNLIHKRVSDTRTDRKRKEKQLAVTNPELHRGRVHQKHVKDRKRKKEVKNFVINFKK